MKDISRTKWKAYRTTLRLEIDKESHKTTVSLVTWPAIDPIVVYNDK